MVVGYVYMVRGVDPPNYKTTDIPYAFPLLPKLINIKPKLGELVLIFTQDGSLDNDRYYIGPIISQPHMIGSDTLSPDSLLKGGFITPDVAPSKTPENRGLQPDDNDIALLGRGSADVIAKPDEVRIRAGKSKDFKILNRDNPSYIQVKHDTSENKGQINIVSNNINLLSHDSVTKFNVVDPDKLITDDEFKKILETAHQLPFGDILVKYLTVERKAFLNHVHAYPGLPPDAEQKEVKDYADFDLNTMLSKNVRCN